MKIKLGLPYNTYDDGDFDSKSEMTDDEFFDRLEREESMSKGIANDFVMGRRFNTRGAASFNAAARHNEGKVRVVHAEADISGPDGEEVTVDSLVSMCVNPDVGVFRVIFNPDEMDEEFEENLNFWNEEHVSINSYIDKMGEDWVFTNEPVRNLRIDYLNKAGEEKHAEIVNCRILDKESITNYLILFDKITF